MPYPYRCGAVRAFPDKGKCPHSRADRSGHYYCHKTQITLAIQPVWRLVNKEKPVYVEDYLPCLFQKTYRRNGKC